MAKPKAVKAVAEERKGKLVPKEVSIHLSKDQVLERSKRVAALDQEQTEKEEEFKNMESELKQARAKHKQEMKNLTEQRRKLNTAVRTASDTITDDCLLVLNYDMNQAEYWYPPKGPDSKIVDTRPLEDNERQPELLQEKVDAMPESGQEVEE